MYAIYHEAMRSKNKRLTLAKVRKTCATESIYTAKEAVRAGLADRVTRHATGGRTRTAKAR
jgi:ATP-dependent protease ClpP protease subunit